VASQWRIRHKLILGLGLVVAIMALQLAGTLKGLMSYRATIGTIGAKWVELDKVYNLREAVNLLAQPSAHTNLEAGEFTDKLRKAKLALSAYKETLEQINLRTHDEENGYRQRDQIPGIEDLFARLDKAASQVFDSPKVGPADLLGDEAIQDLLPRISRACEDLNQTISNDWYDRGNRQAKNDYKLSMVVVLSSSVLGVLLMAGLLRTYYRWVFYPVRDLIAGSGRVAHGDFEHRIDVHSGDEFEDLAAAFNDMTHRLHFMYSDLARQVNERSRQLVRSERLAGVGFLAAGVAHEINNPLASIAFCSEALERRLSGVLAVMQGKHEEDREVVAKYLKMIQQEAFRCKEITQRLLEFSRGGERRREPTDLAELIQGVFDVVQHLQNCKGKQLVFEPRTRLTAWVNAQEIKSVVLNLVVNALDSMDEGGTLTITLGQSDGMAEMVFADTGCGMPADVLENIFEPFFTRSRTGKGTGLGLSISHRIINQHGGDIEAVSPGPNQGSTFTVRLPLQPAEEQTAAVRDQGTGTREQEVGVGNKGTKGQRLAA
jgi:two-component system, NtrC family, sensor kinase